MAVKSLPNDIRGLDPSNPRTTEAIQRNFEHLLKALQNVRTEAAVAGLPTVDIEEGDLVYYDGSAWVRLAIGSASQVLQVSSGIPAWATAASGSDYMGLESQNQWAYIPRGTAVQAIGAPAPTILGTAALNNQADSTYSSFTSAAVLGSSAGMLGAATTLVNRVAQEFTLTLVIRTGASLAALRFWFGLTSSNFTNSDTAPGSTVAFRYSTVAGDTGWVGVTRDGATQSVTAQVAAIATSTRYKLKIRVSGSTVYFSVNDGTEVSATANLPASTTDMYPWFGVYTNEAVAKEWSLSRAHCRYGS